MFDENMNMDSQVKAVTKSAYYQLWNIRKVTPFLSNGAIKTVIHCLVTSRLDSKPPCSMVSYKPNYDKLQHVQNAKAREVIHMRKRVHITPVHRDLHCFPVREHVEFKVLYLTNKVLITWNCTQVSL